MSGHMDEHNELMSAVPSEALPTPEQQDFCCAVVEDNDEYTMLNLHRVLHDYRAKVEKLTEERDTWQNSCEQARELWSENAALVKAMSPVLEAAREHAAHCGAFPMTGLAMGPLNRAFADYDRNKP